MNSRTVLSANDLKPRIVIERRNICAMLTAASAESWKRAEFLAEVRRGRNGRLAG